MTATPTVSWSKVSIPPTAADNTNWGWWPTTPSATPPPITLQHAVQSLQCVVAVTGNAPAVTFTGTIAQGSNEIYGASSYAGMYAGMAISSPCLQNGCTIIEVDSGTDIIIAGKALSSGTPATFTATDTAPAGHLTATVTPASGVALHDANFDNDFGIPRFNADTDSLGMVMGNWSGQGEAMFYVAFANAGSYSVSVAFTSEDSNYGNATVPTPLAVTVT